ncbi:hypothetical protein FGK63_07810 [Ruegeria sediminis]|uniref:Tetratricopeptide repeat protein n=1 Tax=Ruegeria sediminis TaxID=2583820 RepID=A0ABY2X223_9RHOB|nr:hypothetical protein [Ruegeria sediminis]TMV09017.1 hypothetical protein FGK63_07810 [Ruegeria sediminis]
MTDGRGVFIGQRRDRLGARLLMLLTCIRLGEDFGTGFRVNWFPQGADAPELDNPEELFAPDWMEQHFLSEKDFEDLNRTAAPIWSFQSDTSPNRLNAHLASGRAVIVEEGFEILAFPWEDIEAIRPRYRAFMDRIGFDPAIRAIMDRADRVLSGQGVSAYHIRRGDILNGLPWKHTTWPAKVEPEEYYERHLEKASGAPAIMFSDQPELLKRFQRGHPHLMQMSDIADLTGMTRAQRDFLELYAMSRADQIIAPIISAFSMAAARISGRQRLVFRDVLTEQEIAEANERVIGRVRQGPSVFLNPSEAAHIYSKAAQYLNAGDRSKEAYDLAWPIIEAGADNAFLPLLQALNCFYLGKWAEAEKLAREGLNNKQLWPEDHAALCALLGAVLGARGKRWGAGRMFTRAFWAKPMRPDVIVLGSRMLYRNQLPERLCPPIDWELQRHVRQRSFTPFSNLHLVQWKVIVRQPCNFDMILLDWHELALDQKARRLLDSGDRLAQLKEGLDRVEAIAPEHPSRRSLAAMLGYRLGEVSAACAIDESRAVLALSNENPLYHKRLAELLEAEGDHQAARFAYGDALALSPDSPFLIYSSGRFLERIGAKDQGESQILQAAGLDNETASIQGAAGQILMRRGEDHKARRFLERARDLCPSYQRFANQLDRISSRS